MKKLLLLSTIMLLSITAIGQEIGMGGVADYFRVISAYEMYNTYEKDGMGAAFLEDTYSFTANGKTFLVSYDERSENINSSGWKEGEKRTRNLYLYRLDSDGWKIASDKPLRVDYKSYVGDSKHICNYYYPRFNKGGGVELHDGGVIVIKLSYMYNTVENYGKTFFGIDTIILNPIGNNTYQVNAKVSTNVTTNAQNQDSETFKDIRDGKTYKTVKIGTQTWMAENLSYKANDGCWAYNNDENNAKIYGYLYNWETSSAVCPSGWHLPSHAEWSTLISYLGGENSAGGKLKETGTMHWTSFNKGATNETGFTGLPGGIYIPYFDSNNGEFHAIGIEGRWWSNTETGSRNSNMFDLTQYINASILDEAKNKGLSVRCLKD